MKRRNFLSTILAAIGLSGSLFSSSFATDISEDSQECQMRKAFKKQVDNLTKMPTLLYYIRIDDAITNKFMIETIEYRNNKDISDLARYYEIHDSNRENYEVPILARKV